MSDINDSFSDISSVTSTKSSSSFSLKGTRKSIRKVITKEGRAEKKEKKKRKKELKKAASLPTKSLDSSITDDNNNSKSLPTHVRGVGMIPEEEEAATMNANGNGAGDSVASTDTAVLEAVASEAAMPAVPTSTTAGAKDPISTMDIFLLLMHHSTRRFELLQLEFEPESAYSSDILENVDVCTEETLKVQEYSGICNLDSTEMKKDVSLAEFCKNNNPEKEVILVAIPKGKEIGECIELAMPILQDENVDQMIKAPLEEPIQPESAVTTASSAIPPQSESTPTADSLSGSNISATSNLPSTNDDTDFTPKKIEDNIEEESTQSNSTMRTLVRVIFASSIIFFLLKFVMPHAVSIEKDQDNSTGIISFSDGSNATEEDIDYPEIEEFSTEPSPTFSLDTFWNLLVENHYNELILLSAVWTFLFLSFGMPTKIINLLGLPPIPVVVRGIRPWVRTFDILGFLVFRILTTTSDTTSSDTALFERTAATSSDNMASISEMFLTHGMMDVLLIYIHRGFSFVSILINTLINGNPILHSLPIESTNKIATILTRFINDLMGLFIIYSIISIMQRIRRTSLKECYDDAINSMFEFSKSNIGFVKNKLEKEEEKMRNDLEKSLKDQDRVKTFVLPEKGRDSESLVHELTRRADKENKKWQSGKVSGTVYSGDESHSNLLNTACNVFSLSNPLHVDVWPSVNQFEAEVCSMTANLLNGDDENVVGSMSSGGTESIILAVKAHKEIYGKKRGITNAEIISGDTAHAALDKACEMLGIRHIKLPVNSKTFKLNPQDVETNITSNTIMIYASAPNYPQGIIDPMEELSAIALRYNVGLHVDCCLGGFVLPFAKRLGYDVGEFDFTLEGVTSMSCDTHKYGYASKGTSVVLYRNKELRRAQYFCYPGWTGGLYVTPTISGSRPGALIAAAWTSLMALGYEGFNNRVKSIMDTTIQIATEISSIDGLYVLGEPRAMVVCFGSTKFNIYRLGDAMTKKGWSLNSLQNPACIHICVTLKTVQFVDSFVHELKECMDIIIAEGNKNVKLEGNAAIYGLAGSVPKGPVKELLKCYTDVVLTP